MSHYTEVQTRIRDQACLIAALQALGFQNVEVSDTPIQLKGYRGDTRTQKANIRIKGSAWGRDNEVGGASNDLGWEKMQDGTFRFHVSDYDSHKYGREWQNKLTKTYAEEVIRKTVRPTGFTMRKKTITNQKIQLVYER